MSGCCGTIRKRGFLYVWSLTNFAAVGCMAVLTAAYLSWHTLVFYPGDNLHPFLFASLTACISFIPSFIVSAWLTAAIRRGLACDWPKWRFYAAGGMLAALLLVAFMALLGTIFAKPLPDTIMRFNPVGPDIQRPLLALNELPLLLAAGLSGLAAAHIGIAAWRYASELSVDADGERVP
jgi:hypothetical protein